MSETGQVAVLLVAVTLIGLSGLYLLGGMPGMSKACGLEGCGDVYVDSYRAELFLNGTLEETFVYRIEASRRYWMLYRTWSDAPLSVEKLDVPFIEPVSISPPPGTISYFKDAKTQVKIYSIRDEVYANEIWSLAEANEAGSYNPSRFDAGRYEISYVFKLHPPLECDEKYCHLNLKLADEHLPYKQVNIKIHDPDGFISSVFTHPVMDVKKEGDVWIMTGESQKDALLEIEMLLDPAISGVLESFRASVPGVKGKTESANSGYYIMDGIFSILIYVLTAAVLVFPAALAMVYHKYGREKSFTVPKFLSYVPKSRKPWLVNLVFRKDAFDFDENGFYATLLDLHRRKIVEIEPGKDRGAGGGLRIRLMEKPDAVPDEYEKKVLDFLESFAQGNVFDAGIFEERIKKLRDSAERGGSAALSGLDDVRDNVNLLPE